LQEENEIGKMLVEPSQYIVEVLDNLPRRFADLIIGQVDRFNPSNR